MHDFLASIAWNVVQVRITITGIRRQLHWVARVKMKIRRQKVLLTSCGEIEPSSIFPASFQTAAVLNEENWAFSPALENIEPRIQNNAADVNAVKECFTIIKRKCFKKFYLICFNRQWRTFFNIVPAVFWYFIQRRKCVVRCFVYFCVSITQFFLLQTCARPRGVCRGRGALCHSPPFGSPGLQNCIEK